MTTSFFRTVCLLLLIYSSTFGQKQLLTLWEQGNKTVKYSFKEALPFYQQVLQLSQKRKDVYWEANVLTDISGAYFGMGEYDKATQACLDGIELMGAVSDMPDSVSFKLYSALGACHRKLYRVSDAKAAYATANTLLEKNPHLQEMIPLYVAYHYSNQGLMWYTLLDLEKAQYFYDRAVFVAQTLKSVEDYSIITRQRCTLYLFTGDHQQGISVLKGLFRYFRAFKKPSTRELKRVYELLGYFYEQASDNTAALTAYRKSLEIGGFPDADLLVKISVASLLEPSQGLEQLNSIANIASYSVKVQQTYHRAKANLLLKKRDLDEALRSINTALEVNGYSSRGESRKNFNNQDAFDLLFVKREILYQRYVKSNDPTPLKAALRVAIQNINVGDDLLNGQQSVYSKAFFIDKYYNRYKEVLLIAYELARLTNNEADILNFADLAERGKGLLTTSQGLNASLDSPKVDSLRLKLNAFQSYVNYLKNTAGSKAETIADYELKSANIIDQINAEARGDRQPSKLLRNINERRIDENSVYVNYYLIGDYVFYVVKTVDRLRIKRLQINRNQLTHHLKLLSTALRKVPSPYEGFDKAASCNYLYQVLIEKAPVNLHAKQRLIINPDKSLYDISFDVLMNPKTNNYLIEEVAISYAGSIVEVKEKRVTTLEWNIFLPFETQDSRIYKKLQPLRFSFDEVKGIRGEFFLGLDANKNNFVKTLTSKPDHVLMIATHASEGSNEPYLLFDDLDSERSRLYASEIQYYSVVSPLILLSACQTNSGKKFDGLGALSLSKAFQLAGCPAVAGSFWEVDDYSMSVLSSFFYRNMMKGMEKDIALQQAKLAYLETREGRANDLPFYWAHLQVFGDRSNIADKLPYGWLLVGFTLFTLMLLFILNSRYQLFSFFK